MDERELISAMRACIGKPAIAAEPCARVAARYADEREAAAVAAAVDAERARLVAEIGAKQRAWQAEDTPHSWIKSIGAGEILDALRVAASTTPTDAGAET